MPDPPADSPPPGAFPKSGDSGLSRLAYLRQVLGAPHATPAQTPAAPPAALHPAEKALEESQRLLELFFAQSLDGFFFMMLDEPLRWDSATDKDALLEWVFEHQRITRVNDAMAAMYGARPEQLVGLTPAVMFAHDPGHGRRVWREFFDAGRLHIETDERRLDGDPVWVEGDYICLYAPDGRIIGHFGIQRDITARRRHDEEVRRSREELRALAARLQSVREDERTRISREVHDELGQALTGLRLDLSWLKGRLKDRPELAERVQSAVIRIDGTIDTVRRIATELRPSVLDHLGLVAAVEWQAQEFEKRTGITVRLELSSAHPAVDDARATTVFRILQESLTNVARHAGAGHVDIALALGPEAVTLRVADDGRGISEAERTALRSLGLVGIRERAIACGGECTIEGRPGQGTTVFARIPLGGTEGP
jgi:PAS domain S-box-containing protein